MRQVVLPQSIKGKLFLHSLPARVESWNEFLQQATNNDIDKIICLTSLEEIQNKSPHYFSAIQNNQLPFNLIQCAIEDFGTPDNETGFFHIIQDVATYLKHGDTILVHCAAGIGRTGMFACCLLQALGFSEEAYQRIEAAGSRPETEEQRGVVSRFTDWQLSQRP